MALNALGNNGLPAAMPLICSVFRAFERQTDRLRTAAGHFRLGNLMSP